MTSLNRDIHPGHFLPCMQKYSKVFKRAESQNDSKQNYDYCKKIMASLSFKALTGNHFFNLSFCPIS